MFAELQGYAFNSLFVSIFICCCHVFFLQIIFEAERGVGGEIGLDNVAITSGACQAGDPDDL